MSLLLLLSRPNKQNQACPWPLCAVTYAVRLLCLAIAGRRPLTYQGRGQMAPSVSEFSARVKAHVARSFALGTAPFRLNLFFATRGQRGRRCPRRAGGSAAVEHVDTSIRRNAVTGDLRTLVRVSVVSERPRQKNLTQVEVHGNGRRSAFFYWK